MTREESLRDLLLIETSRRNTDLVADIVVKRPELFAELMELYLANEEPVSRRAAWVMDIATEHSPELVLPYLDRIVENLDRFLHDGLKRESLKVLSRSPLPEKESGTLMNLCFEWLVAPKESVAVKMYAMEILYRMSESEPALKRELADSIEWRMQEETPGFRSKGRKLLVLLNRELQNR